MKHVDAFNDFLESHVNLNQTRLDTLQARVGAIENFIEADATFGDLLVDTMPAGSWAHETIIRPVTTADVFDADLLVRVTTQQGWLPRDYIENLYSSFRASTRYRDIVERKTRCVRVNYAGEFHIDLVPFVENAGLTYITNRCLPEGVGRFELSYPEKFSEWVDRKQRATRGSFVKAVRLIKYLRDHKNTFSCKSVILMTLLGEQVDEIEAELNPSLYSDLPTTLDTLMSRLADWLPTFMPVIMDPAGSGDDFAARYGAAWNYDNFRTRIKGYARQISEAMAAQDKDDSLEAWRVIFGPDFAIASMSKSLQSVEARAALPWDGEKFIDRDFGFANPDQKQYRVKIVGRCIGYGSGAATRRRGFREYNLPTKGNQVEKNRQLRFTVAATNVPGPFDVYWKVRNGGAEAQNARQLRGEIRRDSGNRAVEEHTAYKGTHYVECFIVKDGLVVAVDRQAVVVV